MMGEPWRVRTAATDASIPRRGPAGAPDTATMPSRRAILSAAVLGACSPPPPLPPRPDPPLALGPDQVIVAAGSWHTDLCLPAQALRGSALAPVAAAAPHATAFAFGFGLERWMRAARPGPAEALGAVLGGPAVMALRALDGPVPPGTWDTVALRLPPQGLAALAVFITRQARAPLPPAPADGGWALVPSAIPYSLGFTCNSWVMQAVAEAGLPVPVTGLQLRHNAMAALRAEVMRQGNDRAA